MTLREDPTEVMGLFRHLGRVWLLVLEQTYPWLRNLAEYLHIVITCNVSIQKPEKMEAGLVEVPPHCGRDSWLHNYIIKTCLYQGE